jgi:MraZ protein
MFRGLSYSSIDAKGRTSMPAKFREVLVDTFGSERFIITRSVPVDFGSGEVFLGLCIYPYKEWEAIEERLANGNGLTSRQLNAIKRHILAHGEECVADKQGRMLIPPLLRSYAGLERDVAFIGSQKKIEIWDRETWQKVDRLSAMDIPDDTSAMAELGL